jgi:aspartyl-tRNA(Asn)/glutamyl-tRNA(Gln) amidotransferase subunit C
MEIRRELLDKIAHLSRLEFDEKDAEKMMKDMTALREDETKPHLDHTIALSNAPKKDADFFRVPKVLE